MDLGADDYLCKPFTPEELLNAIHGRLQHKARTDERHKTEMNDLCYHLSRSLPHELNTPLNSILGLTDLLIQQHRHLDGEVDREEQLQMLETVRNSSKRLYRVIQNSLIYADLELKAHQPQAITKLKKNFGSQGIEIESFLRGLGQKMALERDRSADLHYDLLPLRVQVPEVQLNKIFQEILDNAFKFSAPGTPVKLVSSLADTMVKIEVQDQGRGMNPSQIASVKAYLQFERRLYEQQGCGLGLAIARRMSELFGGSLAISSIPQQHTTVSVLLPQSSSEGL
jgi:signal transduction histidine kinase